MSNSLFTAIDAHFLAPEMLRRAELFVRSGRAAAEGWFKGEMIFVLDSLARDGAVSGWRADVAISEGSKQRCDFRIEAGDGPLWLEVKTLVEPARQQADLGFIGKGAGFADDLVKLMRVHEGERMVLLFVLPRPSPGAWSELLATYSRRIAPLGFGELSAIGDYPEALYVCKLELREAF